MCYVGCGGIFSRLALAQEPCDGRFLRSGAVLKPLLDLEIDSRLPASRFDARFKFALSRPGGVQLTLQQGQPIDLSLGGVEEGGRPLEARLQVLRGVGIDEQRNRQQVGLLLILITDHLAGFGFLGVQSRLSGDNGGDCSGQVRPSLLQLGRHLGVLGLGCGELLAGRCEPRTGRVQFVLCLVDSDDRRTQCLAGFVEVAFGLGDLLLDPGPLRREFVSGGLGRMQSQG